MIAVLSLATGLTYVALAGIAIYEMLRHRHERGFSHFGLSFAVMALTCGPHHLVHAWRHFFAHEHEHGPLLAAMALGAIAAVIFIALRIEVVLGGRGDRVIRGGRAVTALPLIVAALVGAIVWESVRHASAGTVDLRSAIPNAILFVNYALVAYFAARAQLARRPLLDGWSLSGAAMSGVFVTCALSHLIAGLLTPSSAGSVVIDNLAVPASIYFLWAVHRLHRDSLRDWNRRPLVGRAAPLGRPSPWSEQSA